MNQDVLLALSYIVASVLFILSLRGLSSQETARRGNLYGMIGMGLAIVATILDGRVDAYFALIPAVAAGALVGIWLAVRVAMTAMPELVALLHSFVGAAAVLVGLASYLGAVEAGHHDAVHLVEVYIDVFIGAITFTGSIIAFLKLRGSIGGRPLLLPGRHLLNLALVIGAIALAVPFVGAEGDGGLVPVLVMTGIASLLGIHMVMAIGGADMPVVVSLLNSYSGWTAAAAGFMLGNDLLIVTGALVGSSGAILSVIMCRAMNRSIWNVVFSGFGAQAGAKRQPKDGEAPQEVFEIDVPNTVAELMEAKEVIIVPGYGMAVARAQHAVRDLTNLLRKNGTNVRFGIHPVAGRLPGHMNVLLAEANIPYDIVLEMDELNDDFPEADVVLVIGANDIVNPAAQTDETSTIYGMPVLEVWNAKRTVMMKRGRAAGYAGIDNPLFYLENTRMLFGDAKATVDGLVTELRAQTQAEAA